ncbi:MAG: FAD-dependent oxidoreductase, partial [Saprospiraceae bacterium]|nr:FAD-dependent oxidoreductase [Saprospiraceae bacterium]
NYQDIDIHLIHGADILLKGMSEKAGKAAEKYLRHLGVKLKMNAKVTDYDGETITCDDGTTYKTKKVIWAAGIIGNPVNGLSPSVFVRGKRLKVNRFNQVEGFSDVFALGDICYMEQPPTFAEGHPQVAQVAIQMAKI